MIPVHIGVYRDDVNFYTYDKETKTFVFKEKLPPNYIRNQIAFANYFANNQNGKGYKKLR